MGARCAAFLAYNVKQSGLVLAACTGVDELEAYVTSLDPQSFAGAVAASEQPTALADLVSTQLGVPESLRHVGVRSLLGVRLPPHDDLLGVLLIGMAEARPFTSREVARIESLGERLALHLENARLFDELQGTISELNVEKAFRERYVSLLAHDLRGPLSAARLASELLTMDPASPAERRSLARRVERNIERSDHMIHDLLDANRIRAGEPLPLRLATADLVELVRHVEEDARAMYGDRFVVVSDGPVRGVWSHNDLQRAIWNLVTNAVKYGAPATPITIAILRDRDLVRLSVHNRGQPIPRDEQEHIFDAYARSTTADRSGRIGWGLGLTLVRGTAEAHGGRVSLASDRESGTTFTIELPLDARAAQHAAQDDAAATIH
jgi:signal transduction histidine kinase